MSLKFKDKKGRVVFKMEDDEAQPRRVEDVCQSCQQGGDIPELNPLDSDVVCPSCGRPIECEEEEEG
jgi:hypothetical protein